VSIHTNNPTATARPLPSEKRSKASRGNGEVVITAKSLTKRFKRQGGDEVVPVNDIDLSVHAHEMVVLLGPSGCGKTTLLRCIAGLERPDKGEITISGKTVYSSTSKRFVPPNRRPASMIFQSYALWPHMSVFGNVAYPLQARGVSGSKIRTKVNETLAMVGLAGLGESFPGQISGGQQQRVALARSIVADSHVILFDEPLSNVDAKVREQLRSELRTMQRQLGFSALYVTHDQLEAMAIADRIAVLDDGRIAQISDPQTIYDQPATLYVARFIGTANTWTGTIVGQDAENYRVDTELGTFITSKSNSLAEFQTGESVVLMTRPENISFASPDAATGATNQWQAHVINFEFLGPHVEYLLACPNGLTFRAWSNRGVAGLPAVGDKVTLQVAPTAIRTFAKEEEVDGQVEA